MKSIKLLLSIALIANVALGEDVVSFELTTDIQSKYIWRGQNLSDDPVFQPGMSVGYKNFTAGIWGNMDLTNINGNSGDFSEVDYSFDYSSTFDGMEGIGYSIGAIYYDFPGTAIKDTTEIYCGLKFDLSLSPSITVYHDVDEAEGSYVSLALGHKVEKIYYLASEFPVGLDIGTSVGWGSSSYNKYYWATEQSKLQDLVFTVAFPVEMVGWTITPNLNYVTLLSDDIRDTDVYGTDSDFFYAGLSLSKKF